MTEEKPIVFVVDDDEAVRESLRWLIASIDLAVETYGSAAEFLEKYDDSPRGCMIVDVRMPGISGIELQRQLSERGIGLPVIIVTGHGDIEMAVRAMKSGAFDFIQKPFNDQVLLDLIQKALVENAKMMDANVERLSIMRQLEQLTGRERQVLNGIVGGKSNRDIAATLDLSEKTIEFHRSKVMRKMGSTSLPELTRKVVLATPVRKQS